MGTRGNGNAVTSETTNWPSLRAATAILIIAATGVAACESATEPESAAALAADGVVTATVAGDIALLEGVSEELQLTDEQRADLIAIGERYADGQVGPAAGWQAARDVQAVLTSDQIEQAQSIAIERRHELVQAKANGQRMRAEGLEGHRGAPVELTEDQRAAARQIRETYEPQLQALHEQRRDGSVATEELRAQARALRDQMKEAFEAILTDEQRAELEAHKTEREARVGEGRATKEAMRETMKEAMVEALSLTDEQLTQLEPLRESHTDMALRRRGSDIGLGAKREEHQAALSAILTQEQMEIMAVHRILRSTHARMRSFADDARPRRARGFGPRH